MHEKIKCNQTKADKRQVALILSLMTQIWVYEYELKIATETIQGHEETNVT